MTQQDRYNSGEYHDRVMHTRDASTHAAFFLPYLRPGMSLLDCGCGPGSITVGLAQEVSPGSVVGIDINESDVLQANKLAKDGDVLNAEFRLASVYELPFPDESFDAVFANGVLEHLKSPVGALEEIYRVLKPGGFAGVRCPDYTAHLYAPTDPRIDASLKLIEDLNTHNGGDRHRGKFLRALMSQAGFARTEGSASCDYQGTPEDTAIEGENMATIFDMESIRSQAVELSLADRSQLDDMAAAWRAWGQHPDAFRVGVWCEAIGWKTT